MYKKELIKSEKLKRIFNVSIPAQSIKDKVEQELLKLQKTYKVDGFRPGKVPTDVIRKKEYARLFMQCGESFINEAIEEIVTENNFKLVTNPDVDVKNFDLDKDLEFDCSISVFPEVPAIKFEEITLEANKAETSEKDVEESIKRLLSYHTKHTALPAETISQNGSIVKINFVGKIDGEVFPGGTANDYELKLGSHSFIDNFEDQLIGKKAGDKVEVKVKFPEDYQQITLAGRDSIFDVEVLEVLKEEEQDLTDEFVKEKFNIDNVEKLKEVVKEELNKGLENEYNNVLKNKLFNYLADNCEFDLPEALVENQYNMLLKNREEEFSNNKNISKEPTEQEKEELKKSAVNSVKVGLILSDCGQKENISINEDEVLKFITKQALSMPGREQEIMNLYKKNQELMYNVKAQLLEEKIINVLLSKVKIVETTK